MTPKLSIIIVNYRSEDVLTDCLRSIHVATKAATEIILVDNSPSSPDYQPIGGQNAHQVFRATGLSGAYFPQAENIGYTRAANFGARHARGQFACFLNPDMVLGQHTLDRMLEWLEHHPRTVVGPRELNANGQVVTTAFPFVTRRAILGANLLYKLPWSRTLRPLLSIGIPQFRYAGFCQTATEPQRFPVLSGSCLAMTRNVWDEVGEWHAGLTYFGLESEWFERAQELGITAWYLPNATVYHEHAVSIKRGQGWRVREEADENRRWHALRKGRWVLVLLLAVLWIERQLRRPAPSA
jgi:GT2 family glycosyltransferase